MVLNLRRPTGGQMVWRRLQSMLGATGVWKSIDQKRGNAVLALARHAENPTAFVDTLVEKLSNADPGTLGQQSIEALVNVVRMIGATAATQGVDVPHIKVPGPSENFLAALVMLVDQPALLNALEPGVAAEQLITRLASDLNDANRARAVEVTVKAL